MIVTWLGEQITDKGYGNGVSMIIFAGIVASIPDMIKGIYVDYFVNVPSDRFTSSLMFVGILIVAVLLIIYSQRTCNKLNTKSQSNIQR